MNRRILATISFTVVALLSFVLSRPAGAADQPRRRQATGTIASIAPAKLVLNKQFGRNKTQWNFAVSSKVSLPPGTTKGARVTVYYHEEKDQRIADRIKLIAAPVAAMKPAA